MWRRMDSGHFAGVDVGGRNALPPPANGDGSRRMQNVAALPIGTERDSRKQFAAQPQKAIGADHAVLV